MIYNLVKRNSLLKRRRRSDFLSLEPVAIKSATKDNCHVLAIEEHNVEILKELYETFINNEYLYIRTTAKDMYEHSMDTIYKKINNLHDKDIIEFKTKIINPLENYSLGAGSSKFVDNYEDGIELDVLNYDVYEKMLVSNIDRYVKIILVEIIEVKHINREFKIQSLLKNVVDFFKEDVF